MKQFLDHNKKKFVSYNEVDIVIPNWQVLKITKVLKIISQVHKSEVRETDLDVGICDSIKYLEKALGKDVVLRKEKDYITKYDPEVCSHLNKKKSKYSRDNWWCIDCGTFVPKDK